MPQWVTVSSSNTESVFHWYQLYFMKCPTLLTLWVTVSSIGTLFGDIWFWFPGSTITWRPLLSAVDYWHIIGYSLTLRHFLSLSKILTPDRIFLPSHGGTLYSSKVLTSHPWGRVGRFCGDDPHFWNYLSNWVPSLWLTSILLTPSFCRQ